MEPVSPSESKGIYKNDPKADSGLRYSHHPNWESGNTEWLKVN